MNCLAVETKITFIHSVNIWNYGNIDDGGYNSNNIYFDDLFTGL